MATMLHIKNLAEVRRKFKLLYGKNLKTAEARAMNQLVLSSANTIKREMSKVPVRKDSKGKITAGGSKPFGFPSVVAGNLKGNIIGRVVRIAGKVVGLLGSFRKELEDGPYDKYLEFGTGRRGASGRGTIKEEIYGKEFTQSLSFKSSVAGMTRRPFLEPIVGDTAKLNKLYKKFGGYFKKHMKKRI